MKTKSNLFKGRAPGRFVVLPLTLFFCAPDVLIGTPLFAAVEAFDATLSTYVAKMALSLLLLVLLGFLAIKFLPGRFRVGAQGKIKLVGTLPLGRDVVYVVQTGPEVIALFVSRTNSTVMGRWPLETWHEFESAFPARPQENGAAADSRGNPR